MGQTHRPQVPQGQPLALRLHLELEPMVASPSNSRAEQVPDGLGATGSAILGTIKARVCA